MTTTTSDRRTARATSEKAARTEGDRKVRDPRARDTSAGSARKIPKSVAIRPFTIRHFRIWASSLVLDNDLPWVVEPFQAAFVSDIFAGFLENWLVVPEGNAKTTLAGGLVLYHAQHLRNARVPVAASSRDQAEWLYQAAAGFVDRNPELGRLFRCQEGYRRIRCDSMGSRIQIFAADDRTGDGIIPTLCLLEELHRHKNLNLYRTWRGKLEKRGAQLVAISTAGEPDGEFEATRNEIKASATDVRRKGSYLRAASATSVLHEYAVPEDGDPDNLRQVKAANPLKAITREQLERKRSSPSYVPSHWRRFVCGLPSRMASWIEPAAWDVLKVDVGGIQDGEQVWIAVRAAAGVGIGIVALRDGGRVAVRMEAIAPPPGGRVAHASVEFAIRRLAERYDVREIAYDNDQFQRSAEILMEEGLPMEDVPQKSVTRLSQATATMWRLVSGGLLSHDGDPELRSQVLAGRTKETTQGWHLVPGLQTAGLIALAMACHEATEAEPEPPAVIAL